MSSSNSTVPQQRQTRKGLAIASLILGIISILGNPILGLGVVGSLTSVTLGAIALRKIKKKPMNYGGRNMAVAGIIISVISLGSAAITLPLLIHGAKVGRSSDAIYALRAIHQAQMRFDEMNPRFAAIKELADSGLLDRRYAGGIAVGGYIYSASDVSQKTYCVHATRVSGSVAGYDFVVCEDGIIHFLESNVPNTVKRGEGHPLTGPRSASPDPTSKT